MRAIFIQIRGARALTSDHATVVDPVARGFLSRRLGSRPRVARPAPKHLPQHVPQSEPSARYHTMDPLHGLGVQYTNDVYIMTTIRAYTYLEYM